MGGRKKVSAEKSQNQIQIWINESVIKYGKRNRCPWTMASKNGLSPRLPTCSSSLSIRFTWKSDSFHLKVSDQWTITVCDGLSVHRLWSIVDWLIKPTDLCSRFISPSVELQCNVWGESFNKKSILKFKISNYEPEVQNQGNHLFINNMLIHEKIQLKSP